MATAGTAGIDGGVQVFVAASTTGSERLHLTDTQWLESNRSQAGASALGSASSFVGGGQGIDLARSCDMLLASTIKSFRRRSVWCARWSRDSDGSAPTLSIALGALLLNEGGRVDGIRFEAYECLPSRMHQAAECIERRAPRDHPTASHQDRRTRDRLCQCTYQLASCSRFTSVLLTSTHSLACIGQRHSRRLSQQGDPRL